MLAAVIHGGLDALRFQAGLDLGLHVFHEALQLGHTIAQGIGDLLIARGIQILQGQILQFPLDLLNAEAVGDGSVDLHGLQGLGALLFRRLIVHGAHVVQPVGDLDEHLAQVLHLLVFLARILYARQLCDALDDIRHRVPKIPGNVGMGQGRVLNHVVQQSRHDGILVQTHVHGNISRGHAVGHIGRAVLALLPLVGGAGHLIGRANASQIQIVPAGKDFLFQLGVHLIRVKKRLLFFLVDHDVLLSHVSSQV